MDRAALLVDLYELTMSQCYFEAGRGRQATFDLFVRQMPASRSFLVAAGLADVIEFLRSLRFTADDIAYLRSLKLFSSAFLEYLKGVRFTGDIWAMEEGTVFFPNEPLLRVTADIIQAQLVESFLLNAVNVATMVASKAARVVLAAGDRPVYDFSLRRTHGAEAGMSAARSSYLAGCAGTSTVLAGRKFGIPVAGTMAHSFVLSFPSEEEAFAAYAASYPDKTVLLVDTYDTREGVRNAVKTGLALRAKGHRLLGIRLDSGDLVRLSKMARRILDAAGLRDTKIMASGNLDEYSISRILRQGAPIDSFGVGTRMGASVDAPSLDCIYKLSEISDGKGVFSPVMKLSEGKHTYPGRKQVYRVTDARGAFRRDTLGLEGERCAGEPLLLKMMERGRQVGQQPSLDAMRERTVRALRALPAGLKRLEDTDGFTPVVSPGLRHLTRKVRRSISG